MTMTRQHFELIAETIRDGREHYRSVSAHAAHAAETAVRLAATNPRFDVDRFVTACAPSYVAGSRHESTYNRAATDAKCAIARIAYRRETESAR